MESSPVKTLRALMVIPGYPYGVSMVFARRQVEALQNENFSVEPFFFRFRTSLGGLLAERRNLKRAIRDFSPDILHAHYGTVTGLLTVLVSNVPTVLHLRGSDLLAPQKGWKAKVGRLFSQLAVLRASAVVCVAEHMKESLWWGRDKVTIIPDGVDLEVFKPLDRFLAREKLGWDESTPVVVFNAGRDPFVKRRELAEAAMAKVHETIPNLRFEVLTGEHDPAVIPTLFNAADVLLLTSLSEGSPNVVREAMACNLPVVSVPVADVHTLLAGVTPSTVVPATPEMLAAEVIRILGLEERSNGRSMVGQWSLANTTRKLAELDRSLLS